MAVAEKLTIEDFEKLPPEFALSTVSNKHA
jgi:hypothetical protein